MKIPAICQNRFFLMGLAASFTFTSMMIFNVVFPVLDTQAHQIEIVQADIKQILSDTHFIKGKLERLP